MKHKDLLKNSVFLQELTIKQKKPLIKREFESKRDGLLDELHTMMEQLQNVLLDHSNEKMSHELKVRLEKAMKGIGREVGKDFD